MPGATRRHEQVMPARPAREPRRHGGEEPRRHAWRNREVRGREPHDRSPASHLRRAGEEERRRMRLERRRSGGRGVDLGAGEASTSSRSAIGWKTREAGVAGVARRLLFEPASFEGGSVPQSSHGIDRIDGVESAGTGAPRAHDVDGGDPRWVRRTERRVRLSQQRLEGWARVQGGREEVLLHGRRQRVPTERDVRIARFLDPGRQRAVRATVREVIGPPSFGNGSPRRHHSSRRHRRDGDRQHGALSRRLLVPPSARVKRPVSSATPATS